MLESTMDLEITISNRHNPVTLECENFTFTVIQLEILALANKGKTYAEIADSLGVKKENVVHEIVKLKKNNPLSDNQAQTKVELLNQARNLGLLDPNAITTVKDVANRDKIL
jgi:DNA-binding NarL/FixJ family response regulator